MFVELTGIVTCGVGGRALRGAVVQLSSVHIIFRGTRYHTRSNAVTQMRSNRLIDYICDHG